MSDGGKLRLPGGAKGERAVKRLLKNQERVQIDADLPEIPNASKVIEKLEKRIKKVESEVALMRVAYEKLQKFYVEKGGDQG